MEHQASKTVRFVLKNGDRIGSLSIVSPGKMSRKRARAEPLGDGGSSIVYLAEQSLYEGVTVKRAIKFFVYRPDIAEMHPASGPISESHFKNEILNIASFNHENVVKVIEAGIYSASNGFTRLPYIVSEFVEGFTFNDIIQQGIYPTPFDGHPECILDLAAQLLRGLSYLHKRKFFHCDIAPKNIFLTGTYPDLRVVIGDLGNGHTKTSDVLTRSRLVFLTGSPAYCPPRVVGRLNSTVSAEVFFSFQPEWDVYAAAKTIWELVEALPSKGSRPPWQTALQNRMHSVCDNPRAETAAGLLRYVEWLKPETRSLAHVVELTESFESRQLWVLPVSAVVTSNRVRRLINHPSFIRLMKVPQLFMSSTVFPGANHTRYEHSLGVYENMRQYLLAFANNSTWLEHFSKEHTELALVVALLSSITRFPLATAIKECRSLDDTLFPHLAPDNVFDILMNSDEFTSKRLTLAKTIESVFPDVNPQDCVSLLAAYSPEFRDTGLSIIHSLLDSSLGVRVLDYLRRDSLHLGLAKADPIDLGGLLPYLVLTEGRIAVSQEGLSSVEQVVSLRYWLFNRVYWNRPSRSYLAMLRHLLISFSDMSDDFESGFLEIALNANEREVFEYILDQARVYQRPDLEQICHLFLRPRPTPFLELLEVNRAQDDALRIEICNRIEAMSRKMLTEFQAHLDAHISRKYGLNRELTHILIDMPYKPLRGKLGEDVNVRTYRGSMVPLARVSGIVEGAQNGFHQHLQRLRIFVNPVDEFLMSEKQRDVQQTVEGILGELL